jgi:hypothetical protein
MTNHKICEHFRVYLQARGVATRKRKELRSQQKRTRVWAGSRRRRSEQAKLAIPTSSLHDYVRPGALPRVGRVPHLKLTRPVHKGLLFVKPMVA